MMFQDELKKYVESSGLVNQRPAGEGIHVLKYKKKVFYDDLWNQYIEHCRGTIVDADFNIVSYPFTKIYNYGIEAAAPVLADDVEVLAYRKVNGFMVAATWHQGDILVSTTGSTDSDYVDMAKQMMLTHQDWTDWQLAFNRADMDGITVMFECVHPADPHIVPEQAGMYVLGYRENSWGSPVGHDPAVLHDLRDQFNCRMPEYHRVSMAELKVMAKRCQHEGFVFYTQTGVSAKIKSPYYLTAKWVARNPRTDKLMTPQFREQIDEEYYPLLDAIRENIVEYTEMDEQARLTWVRNYMETV
jgi:hypothetical protein